MANFQAKDEKVPFPRNEEEWANNLIKGGRPQEAAVTEAKHKMRQDVFGTDYQTDSTGAPIERGKGSAAQPTAQHMQELARTQEAEASRKMRMGWHPGMDHAFDPRVQDRIDREVEARVKAALAGKKTAKRKPAKKTKAEPQPAADA